MVLSGAVSAFDKLSSVSSGCLSWLPDGALIGRSASNGRSRQCAAAITGAEEPAVVGRSFVAGWAVSGGEVTTTPGIAATGVGCCGLLVGVGSAQAHSTAAHSSAVHSRQKLVSTVKP